MTKNRSIKKKAHARAEKTGMSYQAALQAERPSPQERQFPLVSECFCETAEEREERRRLEAQLPPFDGTDRPGYHHNTLASFKNESPEIDLDNWHVVQHLVASSVMDAIAAVEARDLLVSKLKITRAQVQATSVDEMADGVRPVFVSTLPLDPGLYDHLVEVSKRPRIEEPKPRPSKRIRDIIASLDAQAFGPGTANGQHFFVSTDTFSIMRDWLRDRFDHSTSREVLQTGKMGTLQGASNPSATREIFTSKAVQPGEVLTFGPEDRRTSEDLGIPKMRRQYVDPGFNEGDVIELSGGPLKPGRYWVEQGSKGFSAATVELSLVDLATKDRHLVTFADIGGHVRPVGESMSFIPARDGATVGFLSERVFPTVTALITAICEDIAKLDGTVTILTADSPRQLRLGWQLSHGEWSCTYALPIRAVKQTEANPVLGERFFHHIKGPEGREVIARALQGGATPETLNTVLPEVGPQVSLS